MQNKKKLRRRKPPIRRKCNNHIRDNKGKFMNQIIIGILFLASFSSFANDCTYSKIMVKDYWEDSFSEQNFGFDASHLIPALDSQGIHQDDSSPNILYTSINIKGKTVGAYFSPAVMLENVFCNENRNGFMAYEQDIQILNGDQVVAKLDHNFRVRHSCGSRDLSNQYEKDLILKSKKCN